MPSVSLLERAGTGNAVPGRSNSTWPDARESDGLVAASWVRSGTTCPSTALARARLGRTANSNQEFLPEHFDLRRCLDPQPDAAIFRGLKHGDADRPTNEEPFTGFASENEHDWNPLTLLASTSPTVT
jgi:hypothetical protein